MKKILFSIITIVGFAGSGFASNEIIFLEKILSDNKPFERTIVSKDKYGAIKIKTIEASDKEKKISLMECTEMFQKLIKSIDKRGIDIKRFRSVC